MLACTRLRHAEATNWGPRRYMNMDHLFKPEEEQLSDIIASRLLTDTQQNFDFAKKLDTINFIVPKNNCRRTQMYILVREYRCSRGTKTASPAEGNR